MAKLIQKAAELGYGVTMGECWRTPEQALLNAKHGIGIVHSLHIYRLAVDINLFNNGALLPGPEGYEQLGTWWKTLGPRYRWGGDFPKLKDYNHFSLSPDGVTA
jgi:hypothetical protein